MAESSTCCNTDTETAHGTEGLGTHQATRPKEEVVNYWLKCIHQWYPDLDKKSYFLPPLYFNRVPYTIQTVGAEEVLVAQFAAVGLSSPQPIPSGSSSSSPLQPKQIQESDVRDDRAQRLVLRGLRTLADKLKEVMVVISQLRFGNYLNKPSYAAAAANYKRPVDMDKHYHQGDFDVLIIHRQFGLITGEIKSVGDNFEHLNKTEQEKDAILAKTVEKAVKQLNASEEVLKYLSSDLSGVNVVKILMLPNIKLTHLNRVLSSNQKVRQVLCSSLRTNLIEEAVRFCLCADHLSPQDTCHDLQEPALTQLCEWWKHLIESMRRELNNPRDLSHDYESLVARFCGPATTVDIYCITPPRLEIRTPGEGVAEAGNRMTQVCLYPEQMDIINSAHTKLFLSGPPGTGKTVMLYLKGSQWLSAGYTVHIVITCQHSRAASYMLENQLKQKFTEVKLHKFDFEEFDKDVDSAVKRLEKASPGGQLCVIADEVHDKFKNFCTKLVSRVPGVYIWAASLFHLNRPTCMVMKSVTVALRSPPIVVKKQIEWNMGQHVYGYSKSDLPAPTDGSDIKRLRHSSTPRHSQDGRIADCEQCGRDIAGVLSELRVGVQDGSLNTRLQLRYCDVLVLCDELAEGCGLVRGLRECRVPVHVVEKDASDRHIRDMALSIKDEVTATDWWNCQGLERKVVVVEEMFNLPNYHLHSPSRCTSQLIVID